MTNTEIPKEAAQAAERAYCAARAKSLASGVDAFRAALEAALPALRKQWGEQAAAAIEKYRDTPMTLSEVMLMSVNDSLTTAAKIVREYGETTP